MTIILKHVHRININFFFFLNSSYNSMFHIIFFIYILKLLLEGYVRSICVLAEEQNIFTSQQLWCNPVVFLVSLKIYVFQVLTIFEIFFFRSFKLLKLSLCLFLWENDMDVSILTDYLLLNCHHNQHPRLWSRGSLAVKIRLIYCIKLKEGKFLFLFKLFRKECRKTPPFWFLCTWIYFEVLFVAG